MSTSQQHHKHKKRKHKARKHHNSSSSRINTANSILPAIDHYPQSLPSTAANPTTAYNRKFSQSFGFNEHQLSTQSKFNIDLCMDPEFPSHLSNPSPLYYILCCFGILLVYAV